MDFHFKALFRDFFFFVFCFTALFIIFKVSFGFFIILFRRGWWCDFCRDFFITLVNISTIFTLFIGFISFIFLLIVTFIFVSISIIIFIICVVFFLLFFL